MYRGEMEPSVCEGVFMVNVESEGLSQGIRAMQFFLKAQAGWAEKTHVELSRAGKSGDRVWTIEVVG
jgi:hypothetical protein